MTCREFTERLAEHLDGTLPHRPDRAMRRHTTRCRGCRDYLAHYRATVDAVRALAAWDDLDSDDVLEVPELLSVSVAGRVH